MRIRTISHSELFAYTLPMINMLVMSVVETHRFETHYFLSEIDNASLLLIIHDSFVKLRIFIYD